MRIVFVYVLDTTTNTLCIHWGYPDYTLTIPWRLQLLHADEGTVDAIGGHELVVGALLHYSAMVEHYDAVGMADGAEAMGYDDGGATFHKCVEGLLHRLFTLRIEGRSSLVENEYRCVAQHSTGYA